MRILPRALGTFDANEHDRREVPAVFRENAAHRDDAPVCFGISKEIPGKQQRSPKAFVLNKPTRF
jgi:hypothetical protein